MNDFGQKLICTFFGICAIVTPSYPLGVGLTKLYQWKQLEYAYPNQELMQSDIRHGNYILGNSVPLDVDVFYADEKSKSKIFVTSPRFTDGVPATLGTVEEDPNGRPLVKPYPSREWHTDLNQCKRNRLVSVYRIKIDECDRLWAIDTGKIGENSDELCKPQIVAFDLRTDTPIDQYELPNEILDSVSLPITIEVDVSRGSCRDTFIYVADCQSFTIIVYDFKHKRSWRVKDKSMYPNPNFGTYHVLDNQWELMDGVFGLALSPNEGNRRLFYHAMTSDRENYIWTSDLKNRSMWQEGTLAGPEIVYTYPNTRNSQVSAMAMDKNGVMYFSLLKDLSVNCWNSRNDYNNNNIGIIDVDKNEYQFISGIKVLKNRAGEEELWLISCRFNKLATGTLDQNDVNFRIIAGKVPVVLGQQGNICKNPRNGEFGSSTTNSGYMNHHSRPTTYYHHYRGSGK